MSGARGLRFAALHYCLSVNVSHDCCRLSRTPPTVASVLFWALKKSRTQNGARRWPLRFEKNLHVPISLALAIISRFAPSYTSFSVLSPRAFLDSDATFPLYSALSCVARYACPVRRPLPTLFHLAPRLYCSVTLPLASPTTLNPAIYNARDTARSSDTSVQLDRESLHGCAITNTFVDLNLSSHIGWFRTPASVSKTEPLGSWTRDAPSFI